MPPLNVAGLSRARSARPTMSSTCGGALPQLRLGHVVEGAEQLDVGVRRQVFEQRQVLRHEADAPLEDVAHRSASVAPFTVTRAGVGRGQAADHADGRRLAGAIRTEQAEHLARRTRSDTSTTAVRVPYDLRNPNASSIADPRLSSRRQC